MSNTDSMPLKDVERKGDTRSYSLYSPEHIANIIERTLDIIRDVEYSIGLRAESKHILLRKAMEHLDFLNDVMKDSLESTLKNVQFKNYSNEKEVSGEDCICKEEDCCDCVEEAEA